MSGFVGLKFVNDYDQVIKIRQSVLCTYNNNNNFISNTLAFFWENMKQKATWGNYSIGLTKNNVSSQLNHHRPAWCRQVSTVMLVCVYFRYDIA